MKRLTVTAIGACAGGVPDWPALRAVLRGDVAYAPAAPARPVPASLPPTERRRANETSRWALQVASEAVKGLDAAAVAALPTVFASADGDGDVLAQVLHDVATQPVTVSPTTFHNSVYNAPAGYWSIAAQSPAASTTICTAEGSFAAGLLEAGAQVLCTSQPVLLVACDLPFPARCPIETDTRAAFACALVLAPAEHGGLGRLADWVMCEGPPTASPEPFAATFAGNGAAVALPLLQAIARETTGALRLPYVDDTHLMARWTPGV